MGSRSRLVVVLVLTVIALAALYATGLFYLQLILVVWAAAVMAGIVIYESGSEPEPPLDVLGPDQERWAKLNQDLASLEAKISKTDREDVKRLLRRQRSHIKQELRNLAWSIREQDMERARLASSPEGLRPEPMEMGWWQRRRLGRSETDHFHECLDLASEALLSETPEASREALRMVARDLKAHYDLLKSAKPQSKGLGDYGTAWAVLTAISNGTDPRADLKHASKKCRGRLEAVATLAASKGLVAAQREN